MRRRECIIDNLGNPRCPECGKLLVGHTVDYDLISGTTHLYFTKRCPRGCGDYTYYTNATGTVRYNSETVIHKLELREDNRVENKMAKNLGNGNVCPFVANEDGTFTINVPANVEGGVAPLTLTKKEFFQSWEIVEDTPVDAKKATKTKKVAVDRKDAALKVETKKDAEPEVAEYDIIPTVFQNRAGKNCLKTELKIDDVTELFTLENTSGSIYYVEMNRDMGKDVEVVTPAKTKKVKVVTGQDENGKDVVEEQVQEVEPEKREMKREMLTIKSVKGSVEEVVKGFIGWLGYENDEAAKQADEMLKRVRQSRRVLKNGNDEVKAFYTK